MAENGQKPEDLKPPVINILEGKTEELKLSKLDDEKPLFLPTGSVRSILALVICITVMAMFAYKLEVPAELMSIFSMLIGFYFGSRMK